MLTDVNFTVLIYEVLRKQKIEVVLYDKEVGFGSKIKDSKLLGFKYIIILGNRYLKEGVLEVEERLNSNYVMFIVFNKKNANRC